MKRNVARIVLITAGIIWGFGFIGNKYILDNGWNDSQLLFVRFFSATIMIFLVFHKRIFNTTKDVIISGSFLGIFLYLGFFFQTWGLVHTTASNNALITAGYIIMMPAIVFIFEKTHIPKKTIFAGFVTLVGISLISVDFNELTIAFGDLLTFIGAMFYGFHIYFLGKQTKKVDLFVLMAFQLVVFSIFATIAMFINGGFPVWTFESAIGIRLFVIAVVLGLFGSFVAFLLQSYGQKHTNEAEAAILISTESLFGPVFAILFYNDPFNMLILLGIVFVFLGIVLSEMDAQILYRFKKKVKK